MRDFRKHPGHHPAFRRLVWLAAVVVAVAAVFLSAAAITLRNLPAPEELFARRIIQSTKIFDRTGGILLYEIHGEERRTIIPFGEIPPLAKNATIAIEDANFYRHAGVDLRGITRALIADVVAGNLHQGGSTITQQLAKNSFLGRERTIRRKLKEALLAIAIEARLSKEDILDLYLNQIPYGSNAYGIEAAAQTFFGKHARDLTAEEAALLAALPAAPSYYSPYGQHKNELMERKNRVLERMRDLGYLQPEEADQAMRSSLAFLPATKNIRAPHFVMYVRDYLIARYGEEEVERGGLVVTTTLDWRLQETAERIVREEAERNEALIRARNMALVAVDPKTGEIRSMVGSYDYFDVAHDGNFNVATARRQPGSAFKPFVYATAFKKGLTPETVVFDVPTEFNPGCTPQGVPRPGSGVSADECYHPGNYDERFRGPVTLRQAIAQSLNVPSVKVLYLSGIEDSIRTAEDFGITSLGDRARFGLSLVLGGAEVELLEMTGAYGVFANDGVRNPTVAILRVEDAAGRILEEKTDAPQPAIDTEVARMMNDVLSDNESRVPVFHPRSSLFFEGRRVAAKTGTTQDFRDAWAIGYTPTLAVGVWAGNNDNSPMQQKGSGVLAAAPSWHRFMAFALAELLPEEFVAPTPRDPTKPVLRGVWQGDEVVVVDTVSGKRATDLTPPETKRDVVLGVPHDPLHWIDRDDPSGPPPEDPTRDPQYLNWEAVFRQWLVSSGFQPRDHASVPREFDDVHTLANKPRVGVEKRPSPTGSTILHVSVEAQYGLREVVFLSNDQILTSKVRPTTPFDITLPQIATGMLVEVRVYDQMGNIGSAVVEAP